MVRSTLHFVLAQRDLVLLLPSGVVSLELMVVKKNQSELAELFHSYTMLLLLD